MSRFVLCKCINTLLVYMICICRLDKLTLAVRETSVIRHRVGTTEGPPKTPRTIRALSCWGLKGGPIMPRDTGLSDSQCQFFLYHRSYKLTMKKQQRSGILLLSERLASWEPNWNFPWCRIHRSTIVLMSLRGTLNLSPIMLRDGSLSEQSIFTFCRYRSYKLTMF